MKEQQLIINTIRKEIRSRKIVGHTSDNKPITIKQRLIEIVENYYNDYPHEDIEV